MKIIRKELGWILVICLIYNLFSIILSMNVAFASVEISNTRYSSSYFPMVSEDSIEAGLTNGVTGKVTDPQPSVIKVACIGDSITAGHGIDDDEQKYPYLLGKYLGSGYIVKNYGADGRCVLKKGNAPYWNDPAFTSSKVSLPDIVIIMLGTNDAKYQYWEAKSKNRVSDEEFVNDYKDLIKAYKELASHPKVFVCLPATVYNSDILGISSNYLQINVIPLVRKAAQETNTKLIDISTATANMPENFPDKIHPNAKGAEIIANTTYQVIINDIKTSNEQAFLKKLENILHFIPHNFTVG